MFRLGSIFLLVLLINCSEVLPTTYYISSSEGNDSQDGKSDSTAWKNLSKVNGSTFLPGDSILLKRGDVWREEIRVPSSGTAGNYIVFTSYGTGPKPKIIGSAQADTWTDQGSNIWKSATALANPLVANSGNICFIETDLSISMGRYKTNLGNLTEEYDWYWESGSLYIYAPSDPGTRYNSVEVSQRQEAIHLNSKSYLEFNGIDLFFTQLDGIVETYKTGGYTGLIVRNCHMAYIGYINHNSEPDYIGHGVEAVYNESLFEYDTLHHIGRRGLSLYNYGTSDVSNITVQNCVFYSGYHTTGIDCANGTITGATGNTYNVTIRNNLFYEDENAFHNGTIMIALFGRPTGGAKVDTVNIYNNVFKYVDGGGIDIYQDVSNVNIYNNTFYGFGKTNTFEATFVKFDDVFDGHKTTVKNNIFYNDAVFATDNYAVSVYTYETLNDLYSSKDDIDADYNLYFNTDAETKIVLNWNNPHKLYTLTEWASMKDDLGWETNSPNPSDPEFISNSDYHLQPSSPAIGAGVDIPGYTTDHEGNPVSSPPSIGAFQGGGLFPGIIGSAQSICYNTVPAPLTQLTSPSGGTGTFTYQWQNSADNSIWIDITGATLSGYTPPTLLSSTYFRRTVTSGSETTNSTPILITVSPRIESAQLYKDTTIANNTSTTFHIDITGGISPFTINYSRNGAAQSLINNYTSGTEISTGVLTTDSYTYTLTSVSDAIGCMAQSLGSSITITATENGNLAPGSIGTQQSLCYNTVPDPLTQITAPSGGTGTYTYQWQSSPDNSTWTNIPGATIADYAPIALTSSMYFRRTVSSGTLIPVNSSPVFIEVYSQITSAQLHDNMSIGNNTSTTFNIEISGGNPPFVVSYKLNGVPQPVVENYYSSDPISTDVLTTGVYIYSLTSVTDANGCTTQSLGTNISITVTGLISGIPNVFTPNNDGINETWSIPSIHNFPDAVIRIYDRTLKEIIQYTGSDPEWNGRDSNGIPVSAGSYLYVIDLNNNTRPIKGYISLVK